MRLSLARRAALVGVAVASLLLPGALPAQAATGTVSGRLTTSSGTGAADVTVHVYEPNNFFVIGRTDTDADGNWSVTGLAAGSYAVGFRTANGPEQFHRQQTTPWDADRITVSANETTTVDEQLFATGTISGQIRDAAGNPVGDLLVEATKVDTYDVVYARTESDGRYQMSAWVGTHRISFRPIEGLWQRQYVPGKLDEEEAAQYTVTAGSEIVVDETVLPTGSLSGTLTSATGEPVADAYVAANTVDMYGGVDTRTGADGTFSVPALLAGAYKISFDTGDRQQFYDGKLTHEEADVVTVQGGQTTTVTESILGTGSVEISAVDSVTGAPIANFCTHNGCSNGTGKVTVTGLPEGRHDLYLYTNTGQYFPRDLLDVRVRAGQTTRLSPKMRPGAVITTTVVDAQTGAALRDVCLAAFLPKRAALLDGYGNCSDRLGRINVGPLATGTYKLFADPINDTYGRQWVGTAGGTGDERHAATVGATAGTVVTGPQVRMDRAGTVSGVVTDTATGAPLRDVSVSVLTGHPGAGVKDTTTDEDGRYTLTKLGPYAWPVVFGSRPYGYQWSGNAVSRFTATPVTVTTGGTATHDMAMRAASRATGAVTTPDGTPFTGGYVIARSADTGDVAASGWVENGRFDVPVPGQQRVYFTYELTLGEDFHSGTYKLPDADGVLRVARFTVPTTGTLTVDLVVSTG
ncbi:carboxypeptidase regulatory-like domain-containing protein [Micromonospora sp. NPDC050187]|uniref:carboxypeptidase regulatory-like domain-containing protein n=1 Tax=Micromonospora sp. NPDC050187 TaxID=3364277 RepID=UPI0037B0080F